MFNSDKFIGIPFVNGGRDYTKADCWGIVKLVYAGFNKECPDFDISCYATREINDRMVAEQGVNWIKISAPTVPCLVVMATNRKHPTFINHAGVYIGKGNFIHTLVEKHSCLDSIHDKYWGRVIEGFYAYVRQ